MFKDQKHAFQTFQESKYSDKGHVRTLKFSSIFDSCFKPNHQDIALD